jgi:glutamate--cysteine ligase
VPSRRRVLSLAAARDVVAKALEGPPGDLVGVELEWPVHRRPDPRARPSHAALLALTAERFGRGSRVSIEPGGQIELSTAPNPSVDVVLDSASADTSQLDALLRRAGLARADLALETGRVPQRVVALPRYDAMERFFSAEGDAGSWMMCNTAALHVNISHEPGDVNRRWVMAQRLGPVLAATFANSPGFDRAGRRWESLRQAIWWSIDAGRTRPLDSRRPLADAWLAYALAADVMLIRSDDGTAAVAMAPGFAFGRWLADGHPAGWPTADDLSYHLTTLFPPVRPRRWLELRMLDALPPGRRDVATLVTVAALTTDAVLELGERLPALDGLWRPAARHGLAHPTLAEAARLLFETVRPHVGAVTAVQWRREAFDDFSERHVQRSLSPAQQVPAGALWGRLAPDLDVERPESFPAATATRTSAPRERRPGAGSADVPRQPAGGRGHTGAFSG